jgi:uncharacterized Tic20 family protein
MKVIKASDEEWVDRISRQNIAVEKRWAIIFILCAAILLAYGIIGIIFIDTHHLVFAIASLIFYVMGIAKYNNFRLYRIIQNLNRKEV